MQDETLQEVYTQVIQAIDDLEGSFIPVPLSLRKAASAIRHEIDERANKLPKVRPSGQS